MHTAIALSGVASQHQMYTQLCRLGVLTACTVVRRTGSETPAGQAVDIPPMYKFVQCAITNIVQLDVGCCALPILLCDDLLTQFLLLLFLLCCLCLYSVHVQCTNALQLCLYTNQIVLQSCCTMY